MSRYGRTYDSSYTPRSYDSSTRSYDVGSRTHNLGASSRFDTSSSTGSYGSDMSHQYATDYSLESGRGYDSGRGLDSGRSYDTSGLSSYDSRGYISPRTGSSDLGYSSSSRYGRSDYTDRSTDVTLRDKAKEVDLDSQGVRRRHHGSKFKEDDEPLGYKHGVNKDDDIALYKASYRRYRDSYGDEDKSDSEKGSLTSSRRESEERDPIAEIKRKYQRKKPDTINENEATLSLSKTDTTDISRSALSDRLSQHSSSPRGGVQRSQSEREAKADHPMMEQTGSVDAEADTMPVWRKRRLEREQRRREFLNMSENKSKERERLKSEETENNEKDCVSSIKSEGRIGDKSESRTETARDRLQRLKDRKLPQKSSSVDSEEGNSLEDSDSTRAFSAEAVKKILLQRDSPLLRTKYAEAKRKKELEKESSREETPVPSTDIKVDKRESVISPLSFKADRLQDSDSSRTRFGSAQNQDSPLSSLERKYSGRELKDSSVVYDKTSSKLDSDCKSLLGSDSKPMTLEQRIAARIGSDSCRFSSRVKRDEGASDSKTISPLNRSQSARAPGGHDLGNDKLSSLSDPKLSSSLSRSYSSRDEKDGSRLGTVSEKKNPLKEPSASSLIARSVSDTHSGSSSLSMDIRPASTSSVRTASTSSDSSSVFLDKYPSKPSVSSTDQKSSLERKWSSREEKEMEYDASELDPKSSFTSSQQPDQQKTSSVMSREDLNQKKIEDKGKESNDIRSRYMDTLKTSEITSKRVEKALEQDKRLGKEHVTAKKESSLEIQRPVPAERQSKKLSSSATSDIRDQQMKMPSVSSTGVMPWEGEKRKSTEIKRHKGLKERLQEKDKIRMKMLESVKQKQEQKSKMDDKPANVKVTAKVMSVDISASNSKSKQGINVAQKSISTNVSQSGRDIKPSQESVRTDIAYNQDMKSGNTFKVDASTKQQDGSSDNRHNKSMPKLDAKATTKVDTNGTTKIDSKSMPTSKLDTKTSKVDSKTTQYIDTTSKSDTKNDESLKSLEEARCVKPSDLKSRKIKHYVRSKSSHVQEDVKNEKPENEKDKTQESSESSRKVQRPYGQVKAKTVDVVSLLSTSPEESSASSNGITQGVTQEVTQNQPNTELSRMERIALYKDERRRQLAFIAAKFGDSDKENENVKMSEIAPSLFTTAASRANGSNEDISTLVRSRSLRENSPQKSVPSIISRSSSLRDSSPRLTASPERDTQDGKVNLASKFSKFRERFNEGDIPTTAEKDVQRKDGYTEKEMSSLEIRRQRLLYGESQFDSGKLMSIKPEEKLERQDSIEDDKPQKKRRQLPDIPAALGGTPEPQLFNKDGEEDVDSQSQSSSSSGPSPPTVKNVPCDASKTKSETVASKQKLISSEGSEKEMGETTVKSSTLTVQKRMDSFKSDGQKGKTDHHPTRKSPYQRSSVRSIQEMLGENPEDSGKVSSVSQIDTAPELSETKVTLSSHVQKQSSSDKRQELPTQKSAQEVKRVPATAAPEASSQEDEKHSVSKFSKDVSEKLVTNQKKGVKTVVRPQIAASESNKLETMSVALDQNIPPPSKPQTAIQVKQMDLVSTKEVKPAVPVLLDAKDVKPMPSVQTSTKDVTPPASVQASSKDVTPAASVQTTAKDVTPAASVQTTAKDVTPATSVQTTAKDVTPATSVRTVKVDELASSAQPVVSTTQLQAKATDTKKEQKVTDSRRSPDKRVIASAKEVNRSSDRKTPSLEQTDAKNKFVPVASEPESSRKLDSKQVNVPSKFSEVSQDSNASVRSTVNINVSTTKLVTKLSDSSKKGKKSSSFVKSQMIEASDILSKPKEDPKPSGKVHETSTAQESSSAFSKEKKEDKKSRRLDRSRSRDRKSAERQVSTDAKSKLEARIQKKLEEKSRLNERELERKYKKPSEGDKSLSVTAKECKQGSSDDSSSKEKSRSRRMLKKTGEKSLEYRRSRSVGEKSPRTPFHGKASTKPVTPQDIKQLLAKSPDFNLDDLLLDNAEYLSDSELLAKAMSKDGGSDTSKDKRSGSKVKRVLHKKDLQRSKSDTSQMMAIAESKRFGKVDDGDSVSPDNRQEHSAAEAADNSTIAVQSSHTNQVSPIDTQSYQSSYQAKKTQYHLITQEKVPVEVFAKQSVEKSSGLDAKGLSIGKVKIDESESRSIVKPSLLDSSVKSGLLQESIKMESEVTGGGLRVTTTDSDSSSKVQRSSSDKRRRKDKSAARKSALNAPSSSVADVGRKALEGRNEDRSSVSSKEDSTSSQYQSSKSGASSRNPLHTPQHGFNSAPSSNSHTEEHAQSRSSVLDKLLPSRFNIPSKVSSGISIFSSDSDRSRDNSVTTKQVDDVNKSPKRIARQKDFSSLLQKFSSSEQSSSESEPVLVSPRRKFSLRRQEACAVTSSDESNTEKTRRTPERTQSLRVRNSPVSEDRVISTVQRSGSFKSDFMRRQSPSSTERVPLPVVSAEKSDDTWNEHMDKPSPELAAVLSKRQEVVTIQQQEGEQLERDRITDKSIEKDSSRMYVPGVSENIVDKEVAAILKSRRKEVDVMASKVLTPPHLNLSEASLTPDNKSDISHVSSVQTSNVTSHKDSLSLSDSQQNKISPQTKEDITKMERGSPDGESTVRMDISAIDTSLAVLDKVTADMDHICESNENLQSKSQSSDQNLSSSLSKLHVESPADVAQFINTVQKEAALPSGEKVEVPQEQTTSNKVTAKVIRRASIEKSKEISKPMVRAVIEGPKKDTHDKTTEGRLSPFRDRVFSAGKKLQPSASLSLKRTQSLGKVDISEQKLKGILKRTPSLKQTSGVIVDAELASILERRRAQEGDEDEDGERKVLSAKDDIKETLRRELKHRGDSIGDDENETAQPTGSVSMAERIYNMQTRLEEIKSCPITPKAKSGTTTPKFSFKRGESPKTSASFEFSSDQPSVSGELLIERLSSLADKGKSVTSKRKQFQESKREDWRRRTQPVTLEEIQEADSLESVRAFRAEVLRKASTNVFQQFQKQKSLPTKKTEFPHPYHRLKPNKLRKDRHKTLPITAAELSAIPEGQTGEFVTFRTNKDSNGNRDSKTDSGILSDVEVDSQFSDRMSDSLRSLSVETDLNDDDPARLSVSAKASIFKQQIEEKSKSASGAKRYIDRKKRERSRTQPVTEDEVKIAATMGDEGTEESEEKADEEKKNHQKEEKEDDKEDVEGKPQTENESDEADVSRCSLAEKVKLFSSLKDQEKKVPSKAPVLRRRNRKVASRFNTQPVTIEEVEKAAEYRISPLAMSLVKPPDPEVLKTLPLSAQRDLVAQHAEMCLSTPSSRSSSRHGSMMDLANGGSQKGSTTDLGTRSQSGSLVDQGKGSTPDLRKISQKGSSSDVRNVSTSDLVDDKGMQLSDSMKGSKNVKSILKLDTRSPERDIRGILKSDMENEQESHSEPKSILKLQEEDLAVDKASDEPHSILKQDDSDKLVNMTDREIPKQRDEEVVSKATTSSALDEDLKSIMKHESTTEKVKDVVEKTKKDGSDEKSEPRGILKKESSFEVKKTEPDKSVLRKGPVKDKAFLNELQGILKKDLSDESMEVEDGEEKLEVSSAHEQVSTPVVENNSTLKKTTDDEKFNVADTESQARKKGRDKKQAERYLTQPADLTTPNKSPETPHRKYTGRHKTQPITPEEKKLAEGQDGGSSIKDRLNALKKSGDEEWRKRVSKNLDFESPIDVKGRTGSPVEVKLREKRSVSPIARPSSIADRLSQIKSAQEGWKGRVEETDAKKFTVAHKIAGQVEDSPLVSKLKRLTKRESDSESGSEIASPSTPSKDWPKIPFPTTLVSGPPVVDVAMEIKAEEEEDDKGPVKVSVPQQENLEAFFITKSTELIIQNEKIDVQVDTFDDLFIEANDILETTRKIRPKRKYTARSKNPLKTMSLNLEVKSEYEEVKVGYAEQELKRQKTAQFSKEAGFAQEALAGLASKENFSKVSLRKTAEQATSGTSRLEPYKDLMLLHVKGRRRVQTRLVEPVAMSINSGDCYVLVTPDKAFTWIGEYCNVIEKAKAADVASMIVQKKDMGCKGANTVGSVEEARQHLGTGKQFWAALGGQKEVSPGGPTEEDELYENHIVETNMIYHLKDNTLQPYQEYWGSVPKYEMLKKDEVIIFDYGTEFYIWQGKSVKPDQRKLAVKLARQLWDKGYDYSSCAINPLCLKLEEEGGLPMRNSVRPSWALFGKVNQNMETVLFKEKFSDWPDNSRLIKCKSQTDLSGSKVDLVELKPYDAKLMIPVDTKPVSLLLEGSHVGRGVQWFEDMEGFTREQSIVTLGVTVWHVLEYDHFKMPDLSFGQFHDGDTYVVRWQYMITQAGTKGLKGTQSRRSQVGRERCAYFFWQGRNSTINEKGASALMTVELDEERGPQIRVDEAKEMPCFLNLFGGKMMIHIGKREEEDTNTQGSWRFFCVRNDCKNEACLMEVRAGMQCLRSRSSFILLNVNSGLLYIWHGAKSPDHIRVLTKAAVDNLKVQCPLEVGLHEKAEIYVIEMEEGAERDDFLKVMGSANEDRILYHSLLSDRQLYNHTIRLFHMSSVSGVFEVHEIQNPSRTPDLVTPYPFLQSDLYKASQPGLFLVDNHHTVFLWHGWWPEGDAEVDNVITGSAQARFNVDRKCAIDTVLHYCQEKNTDNPPSAYAVHAGLEPLGFTNLFPYWEVDSSVKGINLRDGKTDGEMVSLHEILEKMTKACYTFAELQERPLPEGVDPLKLEKYLIDDEFEETLGMTKDAFYALPMWQQHQLKKDVDLF